MGGKEIELDSEISAQESVLPPIGPSRRASADVNRSIVLLASCQVSIYALCSTYLSLSLTRDLSLAGSCFNGGSAAATPKSAPKSTASLARAPGPAFKPMRPKNGLPNFASSSLPQPSKKTFAVQATSLSAERARAAAEDEEIEMTAPPPSIKKRTPALTSIRKEPIPAAAPSLVVTSPKKKKAMCVLLTRSSSRFDLR